MASTVKADDVATQAAQQMPQQINALQDAIKRLKNSAKKDLGQAHWEGNTAKKFQDDIWPSHETALDRAIDDLNKLQVEVKKVLAAIMQAGGN